MIEKLTKEKCIEYEFTSDEIERLFTFDNYEIWIDRGKGFFFASNIDSKIYTGKEAHKEQYFKDKTNPGFPYLCFELIPEYFNLKETIYLNKQKEIAGILFDLEHAKETFKNNEIIETNSTIAEIKLDKKYNGLKQRKEAVNKYELYLNWLNKLSQQAETKTEQETPTFTNNFDNIKPTEIYNHFKIGLVDKGYLTEQELNEYLKAAFELKIIPVTFFKLKHTPTKQKIYTVFYVYYKDISQKKHDRQKEYAALLGNYFEGYKTETIQTNWAREYKTKR